MKIGIAILAFMFFLAVGLYFYINPVERVKPLFQKSVEESVAPDDSDKGPAPQDKKRPDSRKTEHFHTIVVILQVQLTPSLHTVDNEI